MIYLTFFLITVIPSISILNKITPGYPEALCLDGSPSIMYFNRGAEINKFLIHLYGGGSCGDADYNSTIQNCYQRSKMFLGSASPNFTADSIPGDAYFSTNSTINPQFYNWTIAVFYYCDGSFFQGYRKDPISYNGSNIYFRGDSIARQNFDYLNKKYNLYDATDVILAGSSAGAMSAYMWSGSLQSNLTRAKLNLIIDSGLMQNEKNVTSNNNDLATTIKSISNLTTQQRPIAFKKCLDAKNKKNNDDDDDDDDDDGIWKCYFFEYSFKYIEVRSFIAQSQYDLAEMFFALNIWCPQGQNLTSCSSQMDYLIQVRQDQLDILNKASKRKFFSIWSIACANHVFAQDIFYSNSNFTVPVNSSNTFQDGLRRWYYSSQNVQNIDDEQWPTNSNCAYLNI